MNIPDYYWTINDCNCGTYCGITRSPVEARMELLLMGGPVEFYVKGNVEKFIREIKKAGLTIADGMTLTSFENFKMEVVLRDEGERDG